jgi:serine/threonine-protein kinase
MSPDALPPPSSVRPEVPPELDAIVLQALAKPLNERFQTAAELEEALEGFLAARSMRPAPKQIAAYLELLFGTQVAQAKRAIAQGRDLATHIPLVMKPLPGSPNDSLPGLSQQQSAPLGVPPAPRSSSRTPSPPPLPVALPQAPARSSLAQVSPPPEPLSRRLALTGVFLALAGVVLATAAGLAAPAKGLASGEAPATLTLESEPAGAFVFLGGEPTGVRTPATFRGLPPGTPLSIRLQYEDKAAVDTVTLAAGEQAARRLALSRLEKP